MRMTCDHKISWWKYRRFALSSEKQCNRRAKSFWNYGSKIVKIVAIPPTVFL